ncbi:MAG: RecQ family ATP-dependent DNA helicase, partial [Sediminibacterium sp.]|nr:RecQ family ATP-dependent DNA helicase [Sediminibacterium sp.]
KKHWNYDAFRPQQLAVIESIIAGKDTLALLPTGAGKSICFQVPTIFQRGICVVISPLIALMQDQVKDLVSKQLKAVYLGSQLSPYEESLVFKDIAAKKYQFIYCSPEKLAQKHFQTLLGTLPIQLFAIDEAHCISQWGYDFRPSYRKLDFLKKTFPTIPILAMTASAIPLVQKDMLLQLGVQDATVITDQFLRPNLSYQVRKETVKLFVLKNLLKEITGSVIIYCNTRNNVAQLSSMLTSYGFSVAGYHAGMELGERKKIQDQWMQDQLQIMVSTSAFGMGINKTNVRAVIHFDIPGSIEQYYQEAGRAGRDGAPAKAILLYQQNDLDYWNQLQEKKIPPIPVIKKVFQDLADFVQLPVGMGELQQFLFDFDVFCMQFKWDKIIARNALQWIEQEGHVKFSPSSFKPTLVQVIENRITIQLFEKQYPETGFVLQTLLRTYGGILDSPQFINENILAKILQRDNSFVQTQLKKLQEYGMISLEQKANQPIVQFKWNRASAEFMTLNLDQYQARKLAFEDRIQAMRDYLFNRTVTCRNVFLAKYFGEKAPQNCGICDLCTSTKH